MNAISPDPFAQLRDLLLSREGQREVLLRLPDLPSHQQSYAIAHLGEPQKVAQQCLLLHVADWIREHEEITKELLSGLPERLLHLFACDIAEACLVGEREAGREPPKESWKSIEVKRLWLDGKATDEELKAASRAAETAASWAAYYAAETAASRAASRAAYWAAYWAASRAEERKQQIQQLAQQLERWEDSQA